MKSVICKWCNGVNIHHSFQCWKKPPTKTKLREKMTVPKNINRTGKQYALWNETRRKWFQANPPVDGYYYCHYCHIPLTIETVTLDHMKNRSSHPELRHMLSNLVPCCIPCNMIKGSRSYEWMMENHSML